MSEKTKTQLLRFLRVFLSTLVPALLVYASNLPPAIMPAAIGTAAGALAVLWRKYRPLEGTSQLNRFARVTLFAGLPQLFVLLFKDADPAFIGLMAVVTSAMETAYRDLYPTDFEQPAE